MSTADQAEDQVRTWASAAGFVINSAQRDRAGWDHILDLSKPRDTHPNRNLLNIPSRSLSARVQVKSTHTSRRSIPIALSNWQRAIEDPLPWFYLVLKYSRIDARLLEVAAVHLNQDLIERVMRHMHSLEQSKLSRLHRVKFGLTWSDRDLLFDDFVAELRKRIESAVPKDHFDYAENKRRWSTSVGWSPNKEMTFTVSAANQDELYQRLSRAALGLEESIAVSGVRVTRERFGRIIDDPDFPNGTSGRIQIGHGEQDTNWTLGLSNEAGGDELTVPAKIRFSPAIIPGLPEKYWLLRISSPFLDIILKWRMGKISISIHLPPRTLPVCLADLACALQFMTRLAQSRDRKARFSVTKGAQRSFFEGVVPGFDLDEEVQRIANQSQQLSAALHVLRADGKHTLSLNAIEALTPMSQLIVAAQGGEQMNVTFESSIPIDLQVPDCVALVTDPYLAVGDYLYIQLIVVKGSPEICNSNDERKLVIRSNDLSAHGSYRVHKDDIASFPLNEKADEIERELQENGIGLVFVHNLLDPSPASA